MSDEKNTTQRILVVEDSELDYEILVATLSRAGQTIASKRVETQAEMEAALANEGWDAVISDHNLPQFSSQAALQTLKASGHDLPFIILSGDIGEDVAVEAMRNGADDYLIKGRTKRLPASLANAINAASARRERSVAQNELAKTANQLRQLALHLETVKEQERSVLARDLQENVATNLTAAGLMLAHLRRQLTNLPTDPRINDAATAVVEVETLLNKVVQHCNDVAQGLRPDLLDFGLVAAVEWLVSDFSKRTGIAARFESNRDEVALEAEMVTAAFRFVEEALSNIHQHAKATRVECILFAGSQSVTIEVSDDGAGFSSTDLDRTGRFGLIEVRERLVALQGELDISSAPAVSATTPRGATVMLTLPIKTTKSAAARSKVTQHD